MFLKTYFSMLCRIISPQLGRLHVDTLKGSRRSNVKKLRFDAADGIGRPAFACDADTDRHGGQAD